MGYALPWNVRGIDPDIKDLAVEAAHRAGMPVGQWLSHVLADTIPDFLDDEEDEYLPPRGRRSRKSRRLEEMNYRLERLLRPRVQLASRRTRDEDGDESAGLRTSGNGAQGYGKRGKQQASQPNA